MAKKPAMSEFRYRSAAATDLAATRDSHSGGDGRGTRSRPPARAPRRGRCRGCRRRCGVTLVEAIPADRLSPISRTGHARRTCSMSWAATLSANRELNAPSTCPATRQIRSFSSNVLSRLAREGSIYVRSTCFDP
jgi:hypothetical protein